MAHSADPIDSISAIRARQASLTPEQLKPGTVSNWEDAAGEKYWEFVGNGETTGTDFVAHAVTQEIDKYNQPALKEADAQGGIKTNRDFARFGATALLGHNTPGYDADAPIPKGKIEEMSLKQLLGLVDTFLSNYAGAARDGSMGDATQGGGDAAEQERLRLSGKTYSQGLVLPLGDDPT